jgi:pimeloyl-CoA dehydrogenase small subunit
MDFDLTDDQRLLNDSVTRLISDRYGFEQRKQYAAAPEGWSRAMWASLAELGLLGLPLAEAEGGFGGGPVETMLVMEQFGRGLVLEPYLATVVLGLGALRHAGDAAALGEFGPRVAEGACVLAFAHAERASRHDLAHVETAARRAEGGWRIDGAKSLVLHGDTADTLIVSARVAGAADAREGIGLFAVEAGGPGVARRGYPTQDGLRAAEITFADAPARPIGDPGGAFPAIARTTDEAIAAVCAEAVGAMAAMHAMTVDYLKTRKQFGRAIGEFQVLQHRAVDMFVALEQARSMASFAAAMAGSDDADERRRAMAAAKVQIGQSARHVGQEAIQLHGGIGMTMEYAVGHYFKRTTMIELQFGDTAFHLAELARMGGLFD